MKGYNEGSLNVVTILHTDRPSPLNLYLMWVHVAIFSYHDMVSTGTSTLAILQGMYWYLNSSDWYHCGVYDLKSYEAA